MNRNILIIGAGKSSSYLINYLVNKVDSENLRITIGDRDLTIAESIVKKHLKVNLITFDVFDEQQRKSEVEKSDIVVSMLPARFHIEVAKDCVKFKKHMVTASYVSEEMKALDEDVKANDLVFMNEIGLDPGLDHMSAMQVIDRIRVNGGKMILFESFTGGLVAPESDNNLWNYKFTWNPRNVVVAGQGGTAKFIQEGKFKYIPYNRLFRRTEFLDVDSFGRFEAYANRDSLKYQKAYGLENIKTLYRGTIRRVGYSRAWNAFVQLGMTDDSYIIEDSINMSYRDFVNAFLPYSPTDSVELKFRHALRIEQDDVVWDKFLELDIFSSTKKVNLDKATPAQILQKILMDSWTLSPDDKDMIVMYHKFGYELDGKQHQIDATMVALGEDQTFTAMAKTVGLPVAMATLAILNEKITTFGVQIPTRKEIYEPILKELKTFGIDFKEKEVPYFGYNQLHI